jgi:hypothetical protein
MLATHDPEHEMRRRAGRTFRRLLNDLKRDPQTAARELGVDVAEIQAILRGDRATSPELRARATARWAVNERDFFTICDDAPEGVKVMRADASKASARVLSRGGVPYYEYRDTAMTRVSTFRPEWIGMLHSVEGNDPYDCTVQWNNGHLMNQLTYFVGAVNYYYEWHGERHCEPMSTGDSVFGLPYAPHTFARRGRDAVGWILALTFGGRLFGDLLNEAAVLGDEAIHRMRLPTESAAACQAALLRMHLEDACLTPQLIAERAGLSPEVVLRRLEDDGVPIVAAEVEQLAFALGVPARELMPSVPDTTNGVRIVHAAESRSWLFPAGDRASYRIRELATSTCQPHMRPLELRPLAAAPQPAAMLSTRLHQYMYVLAGDGIELSWRHRGQLCTVHLDEGDSVYLKPAVLHSIRRGSREAVLVILRIAGNLTTESLLEASFIECDAASRFASDDEMWFDPAGRS